MISLNAVEDYFEICREYNWCATFEDLLKYCELTAEEYV